MRMPSKGDNPEYLTENNGALVQFERLTVGSRQCPRLICDLLLTRKGASRLIWPRSTKSMLS